MEELKSAMEAHLDQMTDLVQKLTSELRSGLRPGIDNFIGFFHAIDWKEPWLMGLIGFHLVLLLLTVVSRRHINFQMCLFLLALAGVYLAERINRVMGDCWRSFASQNYFDPHGLFLSVVWSGPLLIIATIILINSLFSLCYMIVRWKRAELRHRARLARESTRCSVRKIEEPLLPLQQFCSFKSFFFFSSAVSKGVKYNLGSITLPCTPVHFTVSGSN